MLHVVCAWCGQHMGSKVGGVGVTHGICEACLDVMCRQAEEEAEVLAEDMAQAEEVRGDA